MATEGEVQEALESQGYAVSHRGWPDFLVRGADGAIALVEVKHNGDRVSPDQSALHETLSEVGLQVRVVRTLEDLQGLTFVTAPNNLGLRRRIAKLEKRLKETEARAERAERAADSGREMWCDLMRERNDNVGKFVSELYDLLSRTMGGLFGNELAARITAARDPAITTRGLENL